MRGQQRNRPVVSRNNPVIYLANSTCLHCNTYTLLWTLIFQFCYFYRPPTKFRDANVFSRVCLSFCPPLPMWPLPMMHYTSPHRAVAPPIQGPHQTVPPTAQGTHHAGPPYMDTRHGWTCLNLFNLDLTIQGDHAPPSPTCPNLFNLGLHCRGPGRHVRTCSWWNMYLWKAGSLHSTRILSCKFIEMISFRNEHPQTVITIKIATMATTTQCVCVRIKFWYDFGMVPTWLEVIYLSHAAILELDLYTRHNNVTLLSLGYFLVTGCHFQSWSQHIGLPSQLLEWNWSKLSATHLVIFVVLSFYENRTLCITIHITAPI